MITQSGGARSLVDLEHGHISREIFVNRDLYEQEQERVFARSWLFVGLESQVPNPGDYFSSYMGEESVILTRDNQHSIHVFLNTCRHRGMKVCRYDEGHTLLFTCPYHGWSYARDGKLTGVPYMKEAYQEQLDKSKWGLIEVAQLANLNGSIWATWDKNAPPFLEYLGDVAPYVAAHFTCPDGREGGLEVLGVQKWTMPCNWKFAAENFIGDYYHGISHRSVDLANISPTGVGRSGAHGASRRRSLTAISFPGGHGVVGPLPRTEDGPFSSLYESIPAVYEYFRDAYEQRRRRLAGQIRSSAAQGTVFPNASLSGTRFAIWHPRGALLTEAWRFFTIAQDAPEEVKDAVRSYNTRYAGAAGMTEQDDMENWNYASTASKGVIARRYPYNYEMGVELEQPSDQINALVTTGVFSTEQNQRHFYRRWAEMMDEDR